jgi:hypothetical protein
VSPLAAADVAVEAALIASRVDSFMLALLLLLIEELTGSRGLPMMMMVEIRMKMTVLG